MPSAVFGDDDTLAGSFVRSFVRSATYSLGTTIFPSWGCMFLFFELRLST